MESATEQSANQSLVILTPKTAYCKPTSFEFCWISTELILQRARMHHPATYNSASTLFTRQIPTTSNSVITRVAAFHQ